MLDTSHPHRLSPTNNLPQRCDSTPSPRRSRGLTNVLVAFSLTAVVLTHSGCLRVATAPVRMERREQAEAALGRLGELSPDQIARFLDQRMATQLALTDNQQIRVNAINLDHAQELHAIAASSDSIRSKVRALRKQNDAHEAELKEVLASEQFNRFLTMKEEMRETLKNLGAEK